MNCREARRWVSPYLDSELGKTKTFEVSEHLRGCRPCSVRFDTERQVDDMIRTRLQRETMPDELWAEVSRRLMSVPRFRWPPHKGKVAGCAIAACLVIAAGAYSIYDRGYSDVKSTWIVQRFLAVASDGKPFDSAQPDRVSAERLLLEEYRIQLVSPPDADDRHDLRIVGAATRIDATGRSYVELRLNCCGDPILLTLARPQHGTLPTQFQRAANIELRSPWGASDIHQATWRIEDVVAMVASHHPVSHIIGRLTFVVS